MDAIDAESLYDERLNVSLARPILQGDVFDDVVVPGLGTDRRTVQVVMHPCSMRRGSVLVSRIQVATVEPYQRGADWNGHVRIMPLPDLREDGVDWATKFVDRTAIDAISLRLDHRVASLSHRGILILQQRIVMDDTRLNVELGVLRTQSAPVLAEAEMQQIWVETALGFDPVDLDAVERCQAEFQEWLDGDEGLRRKALESESNHAHLRRSIRAGDFTS